MFFRYCVVEFLLTASCRRNVREGFWGTTFPRQSATIKPSKFSDGKEKEVIPMPPVPVLIELVGIFVSGAAAGKSICDILES